ncbi:hypothetical protein OSTOST_00212 [Ostertagia ostertagi]
MNSNPLLKLLGEQSLTNGRVLVLVQLNGGNDGLNTVISLDRATDIWLTGSSSNQYLTTGWLGRTVDQQYPGYPDPASLPNADPLAVQIGSQSSSMMQTSQTNAAFTVTDPNSFNDFVNDVVPVMPDTPYGREVTFLRKLQQSTEEYSNVIKTAYGLGANLAGYPANNSLANQLKIVARLIKGGLKTPLYIVNHPNSFDTHAAQKDLDQLGIKDRVTGMTFTEFGRRIKSNADAGTDHGTSIPMFFFGTKLNPALTGTSPVLPANAGTNDQIPMQFDFRSVYYTVLREWFQLTDGDLSNVLFQPYPALPIFNQLALPVNILSFTGNWKNAAVSLQWTTDKEINIDYYEIQRSDDGVNYSKKGTELNYKFITDLDMYMKIDEGLKHNAVIKNMQQFKRVLAIEKYKDILNTISKEVHVMEIELEISANPTGTVTGYAVRTAKDGHSFITLELNGGLEFVQSMETGNFYATTRKCSMPCTFGEPLAKTMVGVSLPGEVVRVQAEPYEYTIKETGEVITLNYSYEYQPETEKQSVPKLEMNFIDKDKAIAENRRINDQLENQKQILVNIGSTLNEDKLSKSFELQTEELEVAVALTGLDVKQDNLENKLHNDTNYSGGVSTDASFSGGMPGGVMPFSAAPGSSGSPPKKPIALLFLSAPHTSVNVHRGFQSAC